MTARRLAEDLAPPSVRVGRAAGGCLVLRSGHALPATLPKVTERLRHWADAAPDRAAFVECRNGTLARTVSYREVATASARIAAGLARHALAPKRPLMIVADNGIDHALMHVAALRVGLPFAPLSPNLLRFAGGHARLAEIARQLDPGLIWADDSDAVSTCLRRAGLDSTPVIGRNELPDAMPGPELVAREAAVTLDHIAAIFFTSGSTGAPKGVITTQRMISANQAAIAILWPFLTYEAPRLLDWLPWHHTFGGNDNFHKMLWHGGTMFIDDGRPTAEQIGRTIANAAAVAPTIHINVPKGIELLLDTVERDPDARTALLRALRLVFFAGAGLSRATWTRLRRLVEGRAVALVSGWGSTECGSTICLVHFPINSPCAVGLPLPGYELKLVPCHEKTEARVKGPNVTPGYWVPGRPGEEDRSAFDAQGWLRTGDAARLLDPQRPEAGLVFDGRVAEDFKMSSGTWVSVGPLRLALLSALAPHVRDLAVAGLDQDRVGLLLFVDSQAGPAAEVLQRIIPAIEMHNAAQPASSTAVRRAILIYEAPSAEAGEINDKGHLNQRLALARREPLVARLFDPVPDAQVLCFDGPISTPTEVSQ